MNWKIKAFIQNVVSLFPEELSYYIYYEIQKKFGGLRKICPIKRLGAGVEIWENIVRQGVNPKNKIFLEIGTGRTPLIPIALWLMGAKKIISVDINPYLKKELVEKALFYFRDNKKSIIAIFNELLLPERLEIVLRFVENKKFCIDDFLDSCHIEYIAPCDARNITLDSSSIDFYVSYTVFEHISFDVLEDIIWEANRLIKNEGLFVHRIDYSDHFAHSDHNITSINFLQFSDEEWSHYANNRYMYMNRMRHDDFVSLFKGCSHDILSVKADVDNCLLKDLSKGYCKLDPKFTSKTANVLATTGAWFVSKCQRKIQVND